MIWCGKVLKKARAMREKAKGINEGEENRKQRIIFKICGNKGDYKASRS
jgi:hypothetical protein